MKTEIQWSLSYNKSEEETKRLKVEIIRGIFVRQVWRKPVSSCLGYTLDNSQVEYCLGPFPPGRIPRIQIKFEMIFIFFAHFSTSTLMDLKTLQTHTHTHTHTHTQWCSGEVSACQGRRCRSHIWVRKIPWRRKWKPTPAFLLGNPLDRGAWRATVHGVAKESDMT